MGSQAENMRRQLQVEVRDGATVFAVWVLPRASRDAVDGEHGGALKVRLSAPPTENRANEGLRRLLADRLKVPVSAVKIVAGGTSRNKRVAIAGVSPEQVAALATA